MAFGGEAMSELKIQANTENVKDAIKKVPYAIKLALADGLDHGTRSFFSRFYKTRLQGAPGVRSTPGGIFHRFRRVTMVNGKPVFLRQSASQSESVRAIARSAKNPMDMRIDIYTTSKAAGLLETGGVVRSARGMPIPLNDEARAMKKNNPAAIENLDFIITNGKVFLGRKAKHGPVQRLFVLAHSVRINPHLGFYSTWDAHQERFNQIMDDALDEGLDKANQ